MTICMPKDAMITSIGRRDFRPAAVVHQACLKIDFKGYEISIAVDDSCGAFRDHLGRADIRVYDNATDEDVTRKFFGRPALDGDDLFAIMFAIAGST